MEKRMDEVIKHNQEKLKEYEEIRKSNLPEGIKNLMLLGKLFEMKTSNGEVLGKKIVEAFKEKEDEV